MNNLQTLQARARLLKMLRAYFAAQQVLEVETPLLCSSTALEPQLASFRMNACDRSDQQQRFLQTSPEFAMKRLLAGGSGSIYQICKAFRQEESGRWHNPEFTMLEWYRVDWSVEQLQQEVISLILRAGQLFQQSWPVAPSLSYQQAFTNYCQLNPFTASNEAIRQQTTEQLQTELPALNRQDCLDLLMAEVIEPALPSGLVTINEFPAEQAALAETYTSAAGHQVAKRFEIYLNGIELANGYQELTDAKEQRQRFQQANQERQQLGLETLPLPEPLLSALAQGLPACSGVALGVDRLLALSLEKSSISEVLAYNFSNC